MTRPSATRTARTAENAHENQWWALKRNTKRRAWSKQCGGVVDSSPPVPAAPTPCVGDAEKCLNTVRPKNDTVFGMGWGCNSLDP